MSRRGDLNRFYELMQKLEKNLEGKRTLSQCSGSMNWPERGIYFFFEEGEVRENGSPKVVRVGTHALKTGSGTSLWNRLSQHQGTQGGRHPGGGNHCGSIFRLHVGTAIISRNGLHIPTWSKGSTAKGQVRDTEYPVEQMVSEYIGAMPFLWLDVGDEPGPESMRGYIERNAIGLLSNYNYQDKIDEQSSCWLGNQAWRDKVRDSGLWNVNHVDELYDSGFLDVLERYVDEMSGGEKMRKLMIVQCGQQKIWKDRPDIGSIQAKNAYTSPYFQKNIAYAQRFGDRWMILSAKYGFIYPDDRINDYNVTFKKKSTGPISIQELQSQVKQKELNQYNEIIVLGGEEYLEAVVGAFRGTSSEIISPFRGFPIGSRMSAIDKALGVDRGIKSKSISKKVISSTPSKPRKSGTVNEIRQYVFEMIIQPAKDQGLSEITIRAGDVHKDMDLHHRMPSVCGALKNLDSYYPIQLVDIQAPPSGKGANFYATYKI